MFKQFFKDMWNSKLTFFVVLSLILMFVNYTLFGVIKQQSGVLKQQNITIHSLKKQTTKVNNELKISNSLKNKSFIQFNVNNLSKDLARYKFLSVRARKNIIDTIVSESKKYNINPLILYAMLHTESSMRPWIEHRKVLVLIKGKRKYIRAVGLGGVVWEWWSKQLMKNNIAQTRGDLFNPIINIRATAYIYNSFYKQKKLKKASTQDESAMIRYFGGGYKSYFIKIDKKISSMLCKHIYRK